MAVAAGSHILVLGVLVGIATPTLGHAADPSRGQAFAERNRGSCHATGRSGESRLAAAPPFRILHQRYPVEQLSEALAEGIATGHDLMPEFRLEPAQIDDFLAYLKTLER
jgi:mono/diheme cytochrome c family protein